MSPFGACPSGTYYLCCCCKAVGPLDPNHPKILLWLLNTRLSLLTTSAGLTAILITGACWQDNYDHVHQIVPNRCNLATRGSTWDVSLCSNTVCDSLSTLDLMENKRCHEESLREQTLFGVRHPRTTLTCDSYVRGQLP